MLHAVTCVADYMPAPFLHSIPRVPTHFPFPYIQFPFPNNLSQVRTKPSKEQPEVILQ